MQDDDDNDNIVTFPQAARQLLAGGRARADGSLECGGAFAQCLGGDERSRAARAHKAGVGSLNSDRGLRRGGRHPGRRRQEFRETRSFIVEQSEVTPCNREEFRAQAVKDVKLRGR